MALVSGPGRAMGAMPAELRLFADKHVSYIQSLDTVRLPTTMAADELSDHCSAKTSSSTGSPSTSGSTACTGG